MLSKLDCFFFYFLLYIVQYVDNQLVICNYLLTDAECLFAHANDICIV